MVVAGSSPANDRQTFIFLQTKESSTIDTVKLYFGFRIRHRCWAFYSMTDSQYDTDRVYA